MKHYLKQISIISAIIGGVLGVFSIIPYFNCLGSIAFCFISVFTIVFLKRNSVIGVISLNDGTVIGAITGFIGAAAACTAAVPINLLLSLILNYKMLLKFSDTLVAIPVLILVFGMLGAIFNAFTGMITAYVYEKIEADKPEDQTHFIIDEE
jgi:hypothetical protein